MRGFLALLLALVAPAVQAETTCDAVRRKPEFRRALEARRVHHKRLAARVQSARASVALQDRLLNLSFSDLDKACKAEREVGQGLQQRIQEAVRANRDCELNLALARVYFNQFNIADTEYKKLRDAAIDRRTLDIEGNESARAILRELGNNEVDASKIREERERLWEHSNTGRVSLDTKSGTSRPFFADLGDTIEIAENKLLEHREEMRTSSLSFARLNEACRNSK